MINKANCSDVALKGDLSLKGGLKRPLTIIVLAAGMSKRMGCAKLLLPFGQSTIIAATLTNLLAADIGPICIVTGAYRQQIEAEISRFNLPCKHNPDYALGQSSSLKVGVAACNPQHGLMFVLADQPLIKPQTYRDLAQAYQNSKALIISPQAADGLYGNPKIFAPDLRPEILALSGDNGAKSLLQKYRDNLLIVSHQDPGLYLDIDTKQNYDLYCKE